MALEVHTGTGRLWAVMIQVARVEGEDYQERVSSLHINSLKVAV